MQKDILLNKTLPKIEFGVQGATMHGNFLVFERLVFLASARQNYNSRSENFANGPIHSIASSHYFSANKGQYE